MVSAINSVPVLVWGGGLGGVAAALQAARRGAPTVLLTPGPWLGGMVSAAGVCAPDGNELSPWQTGLWGALLRALATAEPSGLDHNWVSCFGFAPATAERLLRQWVSNAPRLQWLPCCELLELRRHGRRVSELQVVHGGEQLRFAPQLVIDGSDLGDLLGLGGAKFRLGWEAREQWQEPSAPESIRLQTDPFFAQQPVQSPTWVAMGQLLGQAPEQPGALPDPFAAASDRFGLARTLSYGRLPNDLVMLNWPLQGNDWHHDLAPLFAGSPGQQRRHLAELAPQMQAHSRAFAEALAQASDGALVAAAVFPELEHRGSDLQGPSALALMPYWREGRRLKGLMTVIEQDLLPLGPGAQRAALPKDASGACTSIAVGNYANDHHYPGGDWPLAPKSCRWGGRWSGTPFCIPYGALVAADCDNLLAADKGISVSHMANGATRLQPLVLNIGQAAGMAAALCLEQGCDPAELPVAALQAALIDEPTAPAGPFPIWDTPWHAPEWRSHQHQCLAAPTELTPQASMGKLNAGDPRVACSEAHEQLWQGRFEGSLEQGYMLHTPQGPWPLITLEPALHHYLLGLETGSQLQVIGCANRWGPWLRASRLAP